jgi:glycosyltransferase involved in cell wall biosynthesis
MKFSVLMSVYKNDNPEFLDIALKSIYEGQTKKPDEIVVVFDGPLTDELYRVLNNFAQDKGNVVKYYPQEANRGLGESLRVGSSYCTGDYIFRMDSDDIRHPQRFEKQISYIEANPQIDAMGTDIAEFYVNPDEGELRVRTCPMEHAEIVKMGKKRNPMNHVTVCIKKSALQKCGGYESLLLLEDYYLWLKMIVSGCVLANINEALVYVRVGNGFHSKRGSKIRIKGWKYLQKYMVSNGLINTFESFVNMVYIIAFTYCPAWLKKIIYDKVLRK